MKKLFVEKDFGADAAAMIARINKILADYAEQGFDLTLRQLYYQLVAAAVIENSERSYKNIGNCAKSVAAEIQQHNRDCPDAKHSQ